MLHTRRTYKSNNRWIVDVFKENANVRIKYVHIKNQITDIFTKPITNCETRKHLKMLVAVKACLVVKQKRTELSEEMVRATSRQSHRKGR